MRFTVIPYSERAKKYETISGQDEVFLLRDNWDDYGFKTKCSLIYFDEEGERFDVGEVKIMQAGMTGGYTRMDEAFETLDPDYASLGQGQEYYENLLALKEEARFAILNNLRDVVWSAVIRAAVDDEQAYGTSLMRSVGEKRFAKLDSIVHHNPELTPFNFTYLFPGSTEKMSISVTPHSLPPSNIHVVIGRNGVGKTRLLTSISALLRNGRDKRLGRLRFKDEDETAPKDQFANLVTVAFSAFDKFEPPQRSAAGRLRSLKAGTKSGIEYTYVGLKKRVRRGEEQAIANKNEADLQKDFVGSTLRCLRSASRPRWQAAMRTLEADPLFAALQLSDLANLPVEEVEDRAGELFDTASSGHKIVLLTLTQLAEVVSERTLVLIDEPEAHLHPPLVMAFVRALSDLLIKRNGVAILATHSPVVAQEVPADCVSLMFRPGGSIQIERPEIETFAENLGALTREIFRVQVTESGHHNLIARIVNDAEDIDEVLDRFGNKVGAEGRALARTMLRTGR
ncbi:ATP-binding protein [Pseudorhizobium halotolerans]|uniref:ATP-binding protein n=1 Tax=Pseudorhizobium halotolerans TaxID=1233081 RepID=A0ABM8PT83_9HYPH|nr:AAA family ATPase [Pseudorhizobium halotolerans]CAD7047351.1 ATP-binding protein [Pseudorhizobium halotolerans]